MLGSLTAAGSAQAATSETVESRQAVARGCHDAYVENAKGADSFRYTAPATGIVRAELKGLGDWDLALFDADGRAVAAAAGYASDELAEGYVTQGQELVVQACRYRGHANRARVTVDTIGTPSAASEGTAQLVAVDTPSRVDKKRLQSLGLDLTEHADENSVDVVLYGEQDVQELQAAGFTYEVKVADLAAQAERFAAADRRYPAATAESGLPSGSTAYRRLADYELEMKELSLRYPALVKTFTLPHRTLEGRKVSGIEIASNPYDTGDGKPIFLNMGFHHAREWPAAERSMEWAYDLLTNFGKSQRTTPARQRHAQHRDPGRQPRRVQRLARGAEHALRPDQRGDQPRVPAQELPPRGRRGAGRRRLHDRGHAARRRPQPQLRHVLGRPGGEHEPDGPDVPRRRPVLRAGDAEHQGAGRLPPGDEPDHQPHVLEPRPAPAGRARGRFPDRRAGDAGARREDGEPQRLRQRPELRPLRRHRRRGGLDVLDRGRPRLHVRDRPGRVPPAVRDRRRGGVHRRGPGGRRRQGRQPRGLLRDARGDRRRGQALGHRGHGSARLEAEDLQAVPVRDVPRVGGRRRPGDRRSDPLRRRPQLGVPLRRRRVRVAREPLDPSLRGRPPRRARGARPAAGADRARQPARHPAGGHGLRERGVVQLLRGEGTARGRQRGDDDRRPLA